MSFDEGQMPWMPYSERSDWNDVTPLEQDDGPAPIVKINYDSKFVEVFDYFRAIYASREVSKRALELTADAIDLNPANYTVWHHRRYLLKALKVNPEDELNFVRDVIEGDNAKNYQVWQHRRALAIEIQKPDIELQFCKIMLSNDPKNYHAWQHRQWVIEAFNKYDNEIEFVEGLLEEDIRNNSAWNQRFFVVQHTAQEGGLAGDLLRREVNFVQEALKKVPGNESAWNYYRGLIEHCEDEEGPWIRKTAMEFCLDLRDDKKVESSYLLAALVDLYSDKLETLTEDGSGANKESIQNCLGEVKKLCNYLSDERDRIRKEYWDFYLRDIMAKYGVK